MAANPSKSLIQMQRADWYGRWAIIYGQNYQLQYIVDLATLTGSVATLGYTQQVCLLKMMNWFPNFTVQAASPEKKKS